MTLPIDNASMEDATLGTGWAQFGAATVTKDSTNVRSGAFACKMVTTATSDGIQYNGVRPTVGPGKRYTGGVYVFSVAGGTQWHMQMVGFTGPGSANTGTAVNFYDSVATTLGAGVWTLVTVTATMAATEKSLDFFLSTSAGTTVDTAWADDWFVDEADHAQPLFKPVPFLRAGRL
jgi:hypothetical protein